MKVVLHIGPPKTGTTSIQFFLSRNRKRLLEQGVFVPRTRDGSQREFRLLVRSKVARTRALARWGVHSLDDLRRAKQRLLPTLERQLKAASRSCRMAIISSEGLSGLAPHEIEELKTILSPYADAFTIVVYLRRQDLVQVSQAKNRVKISGKPIDFFRAKFRSYATMLDRWAAVFGEESIKPVVFTDSALAKVDHLQSFLDACGLQHLKLDGFAMPGQRNPRWDARSLQLMELLNEFIPAIENGKTPAERFLLEEVLKRGFPDYVPYRPSRADAERYYAQYGEDNERVRRRWFADRAALFHDDFSMYPVEPQQALTLRDCAYVMAELAKQQRSWSGTWTHARWYVKSRFPALFSYARLVASRRAGGAGAREKEPVTAD